MSYYQGDFYMGDPGFFSTMGSIVKGVLGVGTSLMPGGSAIQKLAKVYPRGTAIMMRGAGAIARHPVLSAAGAAGTIGMAGAGVGRMTSRMGAAGVGPVAGMRGYHIEKKGKHAGELIKNRRMRVTNVRALRRAIRRCTGFAHLAKRVLRFTSPRPPRGRAVFKHRRRTKRV